MTDWIDVEEQLPPVGKWVIAATGDGDVATASLADNDFDTMAHGEVFKAWWWRYSTQTVIGVTHWQPLPEPPQ